MCLQRPPCFGIFRFAVGWIFVTKTKSVWSSGLRGKKEKLTMLGVKIWPPTCSEFLVFLTDLVRQNSASGTKFTLLWKQVSSTSFHLSLNCQCHYSTITLFLKQREGINSFNTIYNDKKVLSQNTKTEYNIPLSVCKPRFFFRTANSRFSLKQVCKVH